MDTHVWLNALDSMGYNVIRLLLSTLWQSFIILGAVTVIAFTILRARASVNYAFWVAALVTIPLVPLLTWSLAKVGPPQSAISIIPVYRDPQTRFFQSHLKGQSLLKLRLPSTTGEESAGFLDEFFRSRGPNTPFSADASLLEQHYSRRRGVLPLALTDFSWALAFLAYLMVVVLFLLWDFLSRLRIQRWIVRGDAVTDRHVLETFQKARNDSGVSREVALIESAQVQAPLTCRLRNPVILLPKDFTEELTEFELESIFLHEFTHIRRNDILVFYLLSLVRSFFFFHPLVWLGAHQVAYLSEVACDSVVVELMKKPTQYASLLTRIAENLSNRVSSVELAAGLVFSKSTFFLRIHSILADREDRFPRLSHFARIGTVSAAFLSVAAALAFPLGNIGETGGKVVDVTGSVVLEGSPVSGADIYVGEQWSAGAEKVAETREDGTFSFALQRKRLVQPAWAMPAVVALKERYAMGWVKPESEWDVANLSIELHDLAPVSGKIVASRDGTPITGAEISLRGLSNYAYRGLLHHDSGAFDGRYVLPGRSAITDDSGRFVLEAVPQGTHIGIEVRAKGYAALNVNCITAGMSDITFALVPEGGVTGRIVYGTSGKPAKNVRVHVEKITDRYERLQWTMTTTDSEGSYTVGNLSSGTYAVFLGESLSGWTANARTGIRVEEGKTVGVDDLVLIRGGFVTGRIVQDETDEPLVDHLVRFTDASLPAQMPDNCTHARFTRTDNSGYYAFRAVSGNVVLSTTGMEGCEIAYQSLVLPVGEYRTVQNVNFRLGRGKSITGRIVGTRGRSVTGMHIKIPCHDLQHGGYAGLNDFAVTDSEGRFTIHGVRDCDTLTLDVYDPRLRMHKEISFEVTPGSNEKIR